MVREAAPIDVSEITDLSSLVHEVARTGQAKLVHAHGDVVRISPARRRRARKDATQEEFRAAMYETFGSLKGLIDPEQFKRERRELQVDDRDPRSL